MASDSAENEENPKRFSPQCFLLDFYKEFSEINADVSYENFVKRRAIRCGQHINEQGECVCAERLDSSTNVQSRPQV